MLLGHTPACWLPRSDTLLFILSFSHPHQHNCTIGFTGNPHALENNEHGNGVLQAGLASIDEGEHSRFETCLLTMSFTFVKIKHIHTHTHTHCPRHTPPLFSPHHHTTWYTGAQTTISNHKEMPSDRQEHILNSAHIRADELKAVPLQITQLAAEAFLSFGGTNHHWLGRPEVNFDEQFISFCVIVLMRMTYFVRCSHAPKPRVTLDPHYRSLRFFFVTYFFSQIFAPPFHRYWMLRCANSHLQTATTGMRSRTRSYSGHDGSSLET